MHRSCRDLFITEATLVWSDKPDQISMPASRPRTDSQAANRTAAVRTVNVQEAKTHLSALLARVASGERIVLARNGKPCAQLIPLDPEPRRQLGFMQGSVDEGFFDPLPEDELQSWGV